MFEYVEKNLLEVLEENTVGIDVSTKELSLTAHTFLFSPSASASMSTR